MAAGVLAIWPFLDRRVRRRNDYAAVTQCFDLALDAVSARTGLVAEKQLAVIAGELLYEFHYGCRCVGYLAIVAHLAVAAVFCEGNGDCLFVGVKSDKCCML